METDTKKLLELEEFNKAYRKTDLPNCKYLKIKAPLAVQFELTSGCNQKCIFCYNVWKGPCSEKKLAILPKEKQLVIIDKIIENEIFDIIFSGGEPLLITWLEYLIKKCKDAKMYTTIITNGQLMTLERAKSLKEAGLDDMQISVHHYNPNKSDKIVDVKGAFEKSINGIRNAINIFGTEAININMVALPETYKDIYNMAKFLNQIGVRCFSVGTPSASGEMEKDKNLVINKEMFLEVYDQLVKARLDFGMKVGFSGGFPLCLLPELNKDSIAMIGNYCDVGLNQLTIGPEGDLRPCVCLGEKLGNILEDDLKEIWEKNQFLIDARMMKFVPDSCKNCHLVSSCRGGCRASALGYFGKINAIDPLKEDEK